jgi:hypothetical protein
MGAGTSLGFPTLNLTMPVVLHHAAVIYSGAPLFYYFEPRLVRRTHDCAGPISVLQPGLLHRRILLALRQLQSWLPGTQRDARLLKDRLMGLGIPLAAYTLVGPIAATAIYQMPRALTCITTQTRLAALPEPTQRRSAVVRRDAAVGRRGLRRAAEPGIQSPSTAIAVPIAAAIGAFTLLALSSNLMRGLTPRR